MTDLGDLLGLPPPQRPARARARCWACHHPVYVDQMVFGLGRCCAEKRGLLTRRWNLPAANPADAPTLFDRPEDLMDLEPFPQPRIDVTHLNRPDAHARVLLFVRDIAEDASAAMHAAAHGILPEVAEAAAAQWAGIVRILERHAPDPDGEHRFCSHCVAEAPRGAVPVAWPCTDYRDATTGLACGLPDQPAPDPEAPTNERQGDAAAARFWAGEVWRLQSGLADLGIAIEGPVSTAAVDTALRIIAHGRPGVTA